MKELSTEELIQVQTEFLALLNKNVAAFRKIFVNPAPLSEKWLLMLNQYIPILLSIIKQHGFQEDREELAMFNAQLMEHQRESPELQELNHKKWRFIFEKAFNVKEYKELSVEVARTVIGKITEKLTSEPFLKKVDEIAKKFPPESTLDEKRFQLFTIIQPIHLEVLSELGYKSDAEYIQVQAIIHDNVQDSEIVENANKSYLKVFQRAGLIE